MNTCTVTGEADAKNRKLIRSLLRESSAPILVTGCAINIDGDYYADIDARVRCEKDKTRLPRLAQELVDGVDAKTSRIFDDLTLIGVRAGSDGNFRTRVDLKIQDGCNNACSYCIVHTARGKARSVPAVQIVEQARVLAAHGTKELVLVGIDLAAYQDTNCDLAGLIGRLQSETEIARIRVSSVEPQSVNDSLIEALATSTGRLCRHLHLCLQSGSSKVLGEMNRHYGTDEFAALVTNLRNAAPVLSLSTDIIVGFPGETDEDFQESCRFIERCGFMRLHVFRYSKRPGTPAAARLDQVDPATKSQRSNILRDLGRQLTLQDMQRRLGTSEQIIVERPGLGTSESYHTVACSTDLEQGALTKLIFTDIDERNLRFIGKPV